MENDLSKAEIRKLQKAGTKDIDKTISDAMKGTGWKKKADTYFTDKEGIFMCASAYAGCTYKKGKPTYSVGVRFQAKPMSVDPIYWDIAQLPDNKTMPLSFRAWAAFKCPALYFTSNKNIASHEKSIANAVKKFTLWLSKEERRVSSLFREHGFCGLAGSEHCEEAHDNTTATQRICGLIAEGRGDMALSLAREYAPGNFRGLVLDDDFDVRVNFYELAILYLAGRDVFEKEVKLERRAKPGLPFNISAFPLLKRAKLKKKIDAEDYVAVLDIARGLSSKRPDDLQAKLLLSWALLKVVTQGVFIDDLVEDCEEGLAHLDACTKMDGFVSTPDIASLRHDLNSTLKRAQKFVSRNKF